MITKVKEEFTFLLNQFNIGDFFGIRSYDHQNCVMLHLMMISGLLQQEGCNISLVEYIAAYVIWALLNGAIDGRGKIELMVLTQLSMKAFGGINGIWERAIVSVVTHQYQYGKQQQSHLLVPSDRIKHVSYQEWKLSQKPFFQLNPDSPLNSLDVALYSYSLLIILEDYITGTAKPDWNLLSDLLSQHLGKFATLSSHTLKLIHILLAISSSASTLNQDQFLKLYQLSITAASTGKQLNNSMNKSQQDQLLTQTMKKWLKPENASSDSTEILEVYLANIAHDQRLVKQLYTKVIGMIG